MDFDHLSRLHDNADRRPRARLRQRLVHGGHGQKGGDAGDGFARIPSDGWEIRPIRQNDDLRAIVHGLESVSRESGERGLETFMAEVQRQRPGRELGNVPHAAELVVRQHGARHLDESRVLRRFREDVPLVADVCHDRHDEFFADGVNRRVRHLREELVEVVEELETAISARHSAFCILHSALAPAQASESRVISHGADRFLPGLNHGAEDELDILEGPSEVRPLRGDGVLAVADL